jgi:hypothetical protein
LGYVPLLDATEVKLRRRVDGSRWLLVTLPQPLPAQADDVLLSVSWNNNTQPRSYRCSTAHITYRQLPLAPHA